MPNSELTRWLANEVCARGEIPQILFENIIFVFGGYDYAQMNAVSTVMCVFYVTIMIINDLFLCC